MGLLGTRWEGRHAGHLVSVTRNELTKGFSVEWNGNELARRTWSWIGLGELQATAPLDGKDIVLHVTLRWDGIGGQGKVSVTAGGADVPMTLVK